MASNPCKICGSTDLHLVDGFYYCVECGTQDVNTRETVVEQTILADGTFAHTTIKKYKAVLQDSIEMSGEWHKWHAYNFILAGLIDELIALGAEASVKTTVMWVWVRYIKKFQVKDNKENDNNFDSDSLNDSKKYHENFNNDINDNNTSESYKNEKIRTEKFRWDITIVTKGTLLTILYIALNLHRSDIQLSHLLRFIREGRLSLYTCLKYVPKELSTKNIPHWISFIKCQNEYTSKVIRALAFTFFKRLDLGFPLVPNLNVIINNYVKELCLPEEFKDLVMSLMNHVPCDYLLIDNWSKKRLVRIPDYEGTCMSYILVALKLCFGLDNDYELKLSERIDKINYEENHLKSYKLGMYSEPSERLFSFREWYTFLQFRKMIICKYYLPIARELHMPVDDAVLMDHLEKRNKRKPKLSDEVTMDILNKIPLLDEKVTISKTMFIATLTPMTTYTDIIQDHIKDPDFRLLMCEDFSQYSLKYATKDLKLPGSVKSLKGISKKNKIINPYVSGTLQASKGDTLMVFVRNCDNRNWLKTKPPKIEHVTKLISKNCGENNDLGYDSPVEGITAVERELENTDSEETEILEDEKEFETIENEDIDKSIFDDDFLDMETVKDDKNDNKSEDNENIFEINYNEVGDQQDSKIDLEENINDDTLLNENNFDPETFDRNKVIQDLIDIACKKYKIAKPKEKEIGEVRKRKKSMVNNEAGVREPKRRYLGDKQKRNEARAATNELLAAYYKSIQDDVLVKVSKHLKSILQSTEDQNDINDEAITEPVTFDETLVQSDNNIDVSLTDKEQNESVISSIHPNNTFNNTALNEEEDLSPKDNPDFDAKTHNINQLYVKFNEEDNINYLDEILKIENDLDIEKILEKKIDEYTQGDKQTDNITDITQNLSDSDDMMMIRSKAQEISREKKNIEKKKYDPLIKNTDITKFKYWTRHYKARPFVRSLDMNQKFDIELVENCPKSFVFVISECAAILNCTTFCLYKMMQNLEATMLSHKH